MKLLKAFTLIELLVIVSIIAIIAIILLPNLLSSQSKAIRITMISDLRHLRLLQDAHFTTNTTFTTLNNLPNYNASNNNTVTVDTSDGGPNKNGWKAIVTNSKLKSTEICEIFDGTKLNGSSWTTVQSNLTSREITCNF